MQNEKNYFLGLDIGTDSVGFAVCDENYDLMKFKGEPMWGVHLFEPALLNDERRSFRTARRRLDRRQQRVKLVQEIFAREISNKDPFFYTRIKESALYPEDTSVSASLFTDTDFNDSDYSKKYPTIHHLIYDLISDKSPHDVRLVYLACSWLVAHRGHFLNEISKENIQDIIDINTVYSELMKHFGEEAPWHCEDTALFGDILKRKAGINAKYKELSMLLYNAPKAPKTALDDDSGYSRDAILKMLCGGKVSMKDLFLNDSYAEIDSFSLTKADDEIAPMLAELDDDDAELVIKLKALVDWAVLSDVLQGEKYISKAKIGVYDQHRSDLSDLKYIIKKYASGMYKAVFRSSNTGKVNYEAYAGGSSSKQEDFCKYIKGILKNIIPDDEDKLLFEKMMSRLDAVTFCPKQVNSDNRVIPYQVYWIELKAILDNAAGYLEFLNLKDGETTAKDKILSVFEFRVPYFVGPLNNASENAWVKRKAGKIYPWNFNEMVDLEASEQAFIDRMTNTCTYLPDADVLPKMSLCYEKFQVLNEINPITVNGRGISVEVKQRIFTELFINRKRVTKKAICEFLLSNNLYTRDELETLGGIDDNVKSCRASYKAFYNLLTSGKLDESDVERIIERRTYTESKARFVSWLSREYSGLNEGDIKYISGLKFKDFGRLSRELLCSVYGTERKGSTGEACTILERMWNENITLMQALSDTYTYIDLIEQRRADYYEGKQRSLDDRLKDMYISNSVKRPIIRAVDIVRDVVKANKRAPEKIFVEMARGSKPEEKGKRTSSRREQIMALYEKCNTEDVRALSEELERLGESADNRLQSDRLFLYFMQLGKCMYSGKSIELSQISGDLYDIDHIYPQSKVKDDSVLNNKVLVLSTENGAKGDKYPISSEIRGRMSAWWKFLADKEFITKEKYKRLVRHEPFSETEQWGFINRQLVETRQSTKAVAAILKELYPETEIVYVKAGLVSDFRKVFDILKSRAVNDLHHAKDAYLNIVVGNVYNEKFTRKWFDEHRDKYNLKVETLFSHPVVVSNNKTVWEGQASLDKVIKTVKNKNAIHFTRYSFCRKGGFFDQQPCKAAEGLMPRKSGLPTEKYGGYNKTTASFFAVVKYQVQKKSDIMIMPVELLYSDKFMSDISFATEYAIKTVGDIVGKEVLSVSFPLGLRAIKIGTVFEFDRTLRMYITGKSSGGSRLRFSMIAPLIVGYEWEKYIKRLERFDEKKKDNPKMIYSERYDEVNVEKNIELYDILISKLSSLPYKKRPANPIDALIKGREEFIGLDIFGQSSCLLQIISVFGRISGCDLSAIGGVSKAGVIMIGSSVSNLAKSYNEARIIDMSASGLYTDETCNLLELL